MTDTSPAPNSARNLLEAGDLSRLLSRVEIESALARREAVLRATSRAAERFLSGNWRDFVLDSMRELGLGADVSRVFLFDNRPNDEGQTRHYQIYEWCASGIEPHINDPELQDFELKDIGLERWKDELGNDRVVQGIVAQFPENERPILEALQVQSIIVVPVTVNGRWWGCFGFEEAAKSAIGKRLKSSVCA